MKRTDLAWAAGFFDSSGTICFPRMGRHGKKKRYRHLFLIMPAKDERCAEDFVRMFGGHVYRQVRPKWTLSWRASCQVAERFLRLVLPYLHRKREAAQLALQARGMVSRVGSGIRTGLPPGALRRRSVIERAALKVRGVSKRGGVRA